MKRDSQKELKGVSVPTFLYGTAWKEDDTQRCVSDALTTGFRGIDTANQRKHYHEAAVGEALESAIKEGLVSRNELFLQTKFTVQAGQDHRLPYDANADYHSQVMQSFQSSLEHLRTDYIDSYVLHGPTTRSGLNDADWEIWRAMEELLQAGKVRSLGVSNVSLEQLKAFFDQGKEKPTFVQNRCYAQMGWDREVRTFCLQNDICYQGFSLLTANPHVLQNARFREIAKRHGRTGEQVVFRFAMQVGMLPITGTTDPSHMREDLGVYDFELNAEEIEIIEDIG